MKEMSGDGFAQRAIVMVDKATTSPPPFPPGIKQIQSGRMVRTCHFFRTMESVDVETQGIFSELDTTAGNHHFFSPSIHPSNRFVLFPLPLDFFYHLPPLL